MVGRFYIENIRWLGAGMVLTLASSFGQTFFISLFAGHIMTSFGLTDGQWSTVYLIGTLSSAVLLIRAGGLADRMALGRLAVAIIALYAAVAVAMSLNPSVWVLVVLIFGLRFCGQGMMGHIAITAMGRWFHGHRGRAVAVAGLGYALGEALLPPLTIPLIAWFGWRETWLAVACILALILAPGLAALLRQERIPRGSVEESTQTGLDNRHWTRHQALRHWLFWAVLPGVVTPSFVGTVVFFHQVHISEVKEWDLSVMALAYSLYAAMTVVASLGAGWAVDRFGSARLLPVYLVAMGGGVFLIGPATGVAHWFVALGLVGFSTGLANAMWGAFWPEHYGTHHLGSIKSLATSAMVFGSAIGPFVTGWAIDWGWTFPEQCLAMALWCLGLSALFLVVSRRVSQAMLLA